MCDACGRDDAPSTSPSRDERWPGRWCRRCLTRWQRHGDVTVVLKPDRRPAGERCAVCDESSYLRGFCNRHYIRWQRHGDPLAGGRDRPTAGGDAARVFWGNVERTEHGLLWVGPRQKPVVRHGRELVYGRASVGNRRMYAHRLAYEVQVGPIPAGDYVVDHDPGCPRLCVTADHLTLYTRGEHSAVGYARGELTRDRAGWTSSSP